MQRSAAAAQVPELPRELVVAIARAAKHGGVLTRMLQVCRAWRGALNAEIISLWRETALARYPRLHGIVASAGAQAPCYRTLYRNQLDADATARTQTLRDAAPDPGLDQYVVTIELEVARLSEVDVDQYVIARLSFRMDQTPINAGEFCVSVTLTKEAAYDRLIPPIPLDGVVETASDAAAMIANFGSIKVYVTRLTDMKTTRLMASGVAMVDEDYDVCFQRRDMPRTGQLFGNTGVNAESQPAIKAWYYPRTARFDFHLYETPMRDDDGTPIKDARDELMTVLEVKRYLARFAVWG